MEDNLANLLVLASSIHDKDAMLEVIMKFKPLIIKTANKLDYDGADTDLIIYLIEKVYMMDESSIRLRCEGELVNYIATIIRNRGVDLFRERGRKVAEIHSLEMIHAAERIAELEPMINTKEYINVLNSKEKNIIVLRYVHGYSDAEIGIKLGITRQAVCSTRRRALEKMRREIEQDGCTNN